MKLFTLTEAPKKSKLIKKDGPVHSFKYDNWHTDKRPSILYLGKWRHPKTGNMLIGGVNLNKLNPKELSIIQNKLPEIYPPSFSSSFFTTAGMKGIGSLKDNYDRLKQIAPWIIQTRRYQTWDKKFIHSVTTDLLNFIPATAIDKTADATSSSHPAYAEPEEMEKDLGNDARMQDLIKKSNDSEVKEPAKKPTGPNQPQPIKSSQKEGQPVAQEPTTGATPETDSPTEKAPEQQEPEIPNAPPSPSPIAFKVSTSAQDIAKINATTQIPTAGGVMKKRKTVTGAAVRRSGNAAGPLADQFLASKIKK